ncbi:MAG: SDR family oxidoreductase [Bacteroidetes bacterium]|nr:SDR family oxidoreductase [Bacteroidota bacterium]MBU1717487.1 SDR family oxidoreductase [Bacteroidota bacterium]
MYLHSLHSGDISKFRFLVTGGAGFIGSHIVEYLTKYNAGHVRVIDNLITGSLRNIYTYRGLPNFEFINGDICDIETVKKSMKNIDFVIHQAALGSIPRSIANPLASNDTNVTGFLNVLTASKDTGVKRVVYATSSSVYGTDKTLPKVEETTGDPLSPYAATKKMNEMYAGVFNKCYNQDNIGLRYFNVFGPRQNPEGPYAAAIPIFINALLNNSVPTIFGDGEQSRDFTFVENVVAAVIKAVFTTNEEAPGNLFNVGNGNITSINRVYEILSRFSKNNLPPVYQDPRPGDILHSQADISKAKKILDYLPVLEMEKGLAVTFNWFQKNYSPVK